MPTRQVHTSLSTGMPGLDAVFGGVRPGDNIVWQVDAIEDYVPFVYPFCAEANAKGHPLIYFRFADHPSLMPLTAQAEIHLLHPEEGFENFISEIFDVIEKRGTGACYVFDCLSELSVDWYSDRMLANFFMLTCPYLYDYETATYFSLLRNRHMSVAPTAIHATAQVVVDVFRNRDRLYIHPLKVYKRHSATMYMLHGWVDDSFSPVSNSAVIAEVMASVPQPWLDFSVQKLDFWTRTLTQAQQCVAAQSSGSVCDDVDTLKQRLLRMAVTREGRLLDLAARFLELKDLVNIGKRMIGTGLIGGKSVGMLVARAILLKHSPRWEEILEPHDSFFIGSDVFYTYLIENGCWWVRRRVHRSGSLLDGAEEAQQRMLSGVFPPEIQAHFSQMLDYFGQSPIIVRSSSLLEDAYGNAFSGKYESVFCANQGTPQERLDSFMSAVRTVYASTMQREALSYRAHWGLLEHDEQMALLVQRVSGSSTDGLFFPHAAGVGFSYNPFVWSSDIDPHAGVLRLVFGLGTRAVDRADDDYTRVVALNAPAKRPESSLNDAHRFTQRRVDVLNLRENRLASALFEEIGVGIPSELRDLCASVDEAYVRRAQEHGVRAGFPYVLTFDRLLLATGFVPDMRDLLTTLEAAYHYPVDVEFAINFAADSTYRVNLLQCRPFQVKGEMRAVASADPIGDDRVLLRSAGPIIGAGMAASVDRLIYVSPAGYSSLSTNDRYSIARLVGRLTHLRIDKETGKPVIVLVGPGRWGTSTPELGVPVHLQEINTVSVICELAAMHEGLIPDVSLGTHFFNDLVELDMLYLAVYPDRAGHRWNGALLQSLPNALPELLPEAASWAHVVKVIDRPGEGHGIALNANALGQEAVCYVE